MKKSFIHQQEEISFVKTTFTQYLKDKLEVVEVQGPILSKVGDGMQDNLSGVENPVSVKVLQIPNETYEVVHSLAKWKRHTLARFGFGEGEGLFVHMKALRPDEDSLDATHSVYVDQWDWEKIISEQDRTLDTLKDAMRRIVTAVCCTLDFLKWKYPQLPVELCRDVSFVTTQELEDMYPDLTPKQRENAYLREHRTAGILQIGGKLRSGKPHDGRAPDYDDWALNGDIMFYNDVLGCAFELSSMGVRVSPESLRAQLAEAGCPERAELPFHRMLLAGELPFTMGGGIGQSRMCMLLLAKEHIGEVQSSLWDAETRRVCRDAGIVLL